MTKIVAIIATIIVVVVGVTSMQMQSHAETVQISFDAIFGHNHDGVNSAKLATASVNSTQLVTSAVTTSKIADGAITQEKLAAGVGGIPSGLVGFFASSSCPSEWSEFTDLRGRYVVGLPSSGTLNATVGQTLTDQENRSVGQHNHTGSTDTTGAHTHTISTSSSSTNGGGIKNALGGGSTGTTNSAGDHSHTLTIDNAGSVAGTNAPYIQLLACKKN